MEIVYQIVVVVVEIEKVDFLQMVEVVGFPVPLEVEKDLVLEVEKDLVLEVEKDLVQ